MSPLREIVATVLPSYPTLSRDDRRQVERDVTLYVASQIGAMPSFLRLPYRLALVAFDLLAIPRFARRFRGLGDESRASYLTSWSAAPLSPMRDLVKLIRSTALFVYFDHPVVRQHLEREPASATAPAVEAGRS